MSSYRLTVVRQEGDCHQTDFSGYNAETAMIHFRREAKRCKRTMSVFVHEGVSGAWMPYSNEHAPFLGQQSQED